jgi:hypothetical protein
VTNTNSFTFCFPHSAPNGVSNSFIRIIEKLLEHNIQIKIRVIDYFDSFLFKTITERKMTQVELLTFENDKPIKINNDTILILQACLPDQIPKELNINEDTKIFFWALHQFNFTSFPPIIYKYLASNENLHKFYINFKHKRRLVEFINKLQLNNAIIFADQSIVKVTSRRLGLKIPSPQIVPVPYNIDKFKEIKPKNRKKIKNIAWLGQLVDFKIHILEYSLRQLSIYAKINRKYINFHIIGDGLYLDWFKVKSITTEHEFFKLIFTGVLYHEKRDTYLINNIDMMFAMGTSAIDAGILGIPTILLDMSYTPIKEHYIFKWLYLSDYGLGDLIDLSHFKNNNSSLSDLIEEAESNYEIVSSRTIEYIIENHSSEIAYNNFLKSINKSTFFYDDIDKHLINDNNTKHSIKGFIRRRPRLYNYLKKSRLLFKYDT